MPDTLHQTKPRIAGLRRLRGERLGVVAEKWPNPMPKEPAAVAGNTPLVQAVEHLTAETKVWLRPWPKTEHRPSAWSPVR